MNTQFRVRRKSDGMFLGARKWGESHSKNGKFYATRGHAMSAVKGAYVKASEHELVEYEMVERRAQPLS